METEAEVLDTNINELPDNLAFVKINHGSIYFDGSSVLRSNSIFLGSALRISTFDSNKSHSIFRVEFSERRFITLRCSTKYYMNNIKNLRLISGEPFEVKNSLSGLGFMGCFVIPLLVFILLVAIQPSGSQKNLTEADMSKICKSYIGNIFSKPISIINNYKTKGSLVYVSYIRRADNSKWSYVCDLSGNKITWASWFSDTAEWGRWRTEYEAELTYDETNNTVSFEVEGSIVTVKL